MYLKARGKWPSGATPWCPSQNSMQAIFIAISIRSSGLELSHCSLSLSHTLSLNIQFSLLSVISRLSLLMDKPFCDPLSIVDMHCLEHSCNTPSLKSTSIMSWTTCKLTLHQHTANNITLQQAMRYILPWQPLTSHNFTRLFNKRTQLLSMRLMKKVCIPLFY